MNKERREELFDVTDLLEEAKGRICEIRCEEEDALFAMPDSLQESSRGCAMQDAMDALDRFHDLIDDAQRLIEEFAIPKKTEKRKKP